MPAAAVAGAAFAENDRALVPVPRLESSPIATAPPGFLGVAREVRGDMGDAGEDMPDGEPTSPGEALPPRIVPSPLVFDRWSLHLWSFGLLIPATMD